MNDMRKMFKKPHNIALYPERTEFQEFGKPDRGYRRCRVCNAIYYDKSWHREKQARLHRLLSLHKIWVATCPACQMIRDHEFEGKIMIENIPARFQDELCHLIKGFGARAYEQDCQHRIIAVTKEDKRAWIVTTTENQLAEKIAKKIKEVFDKVEVKTSYSRAPDDVERVRVSFKPFYEFENKRG